MKAQTEYWVDVAEAILRESTLSIPTMARYFRTYPQFYSNMEAMFRELIQPPEPAWDKWLDENT